ncbi:MAG: DUF4041 domain-containing protein [Hymenobacter sp.]|nr:MAG: DUF4041 domain-containing protein [Hymenobacter sp.]
MSTTTLFEVLSAVLGVLLLVLLLRLRQAGKAKDAALEQHNVLKAEELAQVAQAREQDAEAHRQQLARYQTIVDVEAERDRVQVVTATERAQVLRELAEARTQTESEQARLTKAAQITREQILAKLTTEEDALRAKLQQLHQQKRHADEETTTLQRQVNALRTELKALDEQAALQSFGFYESKYSFETSTSYQLELAHIRDAQKRMITAKTAATCDIDWTVNGSVVEGRKQTNQTLKLMLRAFNGECDAAVAKVKYNNVAAMETRIRKAYEVINSLAAVQQAMLANTYFELKLKELYLAHEYQEKLQAEKEEQRQIREQMREEELAQREIEKAQQDAEKEERRYAEALRKAQEEVGKAAGAKQAKLQAEIEQLQLRLAQASLNKERAISRAQLTRSGHVYVISNVGSFGEDVYKIGMTRRLEPMDRVRELGDASVPFHFDVHAIIYCEDAPLLENQLHKEFHKRRVNQVNHRKEFFRVSLTEIAEAVRQHHAEIEFTLAAEAVDYRKSQSLLADYTAQQKI